MSGGLNYAATCGGRLDIVTARRLSAQMLQKELVPFVCTGFREC